MSETRIRVFSVDDHPLLREGIAAMINSQPDMTMAGQADNGRDAIRQYPILRPDVTLMDLRLPDVGGIEAMIAIRDDFPSARIVVLTTFEGDAEIQRALAAGAAGYLLKTTPPGELLAAIRHVHAGGRRVAADAAAQLAEHLGEEPLTPREKAVLERIAGNRNHEIAAALGIAEETVKVHVKHIMDKLGATDRTEAVAIAIRRGIIDLPVPRKR